MFSNLNRLRQQARIGLFTLPSGKRVGKFALVMILLLDIQVLYSVLNGASRAGESVRPPVSRVPEKCTSFYTDFPKMKDDGKIEFVAGFMPTKDHEPSPGMLTDTGRYDVQPDATTAVRGGAVAEACAQAHAELQRLGQSQAFFGFYQERAELTRQNAELEGEISNLKSTYDSALLEKIAGQKSSDSILPSAAQDTRKKIENANSELDQHKKRLQKIHSEILGSTAFAQLLEFARRPLATSEIERERAQYRRAFQLYPVKSVGLEILFLLPLLVIAAAWNRRAKRRDAQLQTMASSHMILIALLPILFKLFYLIYELIPHTFFSRLFALLTALNLEYVWNYVAIIGSILLVSFVIWISQKFVLNAARRQRGRIKHCACVVCEEKLSSRAIAFCYFCGASQLASCPTCQHLRNRNFLYCDQCGTASEKVA